MLIPEDKPIGDKPAKDRSIGDKAEDKWKKWVVGFVCLAAIAVSLLVIVREIPPPRNASPPTLGYPGRGGAPGGPQMLGTRGQITTVSADATTISARDGGAKTFALTTTTKITVDQKPMTAADPKAGQRARITSADGKSASEIYIRTHPLSGGGYPGGGPSASGGYPGSGAAAAAAAGL